MIAEGASVIDVGGESTRPFSNPVTAEEEMERVFPVIRRLVREVNVPVSIDTRNVETAKACIEEGVSVINDVFGLRGKGMERLAVDREVTAVIMHMKGEPKVMQELPRYDDVVSEVRDFLRSRVERIVSIGGKKERLIIDPGIGFGKELRHNLELLNGLRSLTEIGCHVMVGVSRKSFIGKLLDTGVENRLEGSLAAALASVERGASVVRVHDVAATHRALVVQKAIMDPGSIGFIR
jgi:dihydropteroate synthase